MIHPQRLLNGWRRTHFAAAAGLAAPHAVPAADDVVVNAVPPIVAAALCIKPRGMLTQARVAKVARPKEGSAEFAAMRQLAMRFRGLLKGSDAVPLENWLSDAAGSGIHAMRQFAATLRQDLAAVRNAITEPWSNGLAEA